MLTRGVNPLMLFVVTIGVIGISLFVLAEPRAQAQMKGDAERGAYVFALAGGCGCHDSEAGLLAGGHEYGPFYAANITSDPETGIGEWTEQELVDAIRLGKDRDGSQLGIMPFDDYSHMADQDAYDLAAFLLATDPIANEVPESDAVAPAFETDVEPPEEAPAEGVERGAYIVHVAHCSHCHTPTNKDETPDMTRYLGGKIHPSWGYVPNLTPDEQTGLGKWSEDEIATFLRTAVRPDGSEHEGEMMPGVILGTGRYEEWDEEDALAVAGYLKTVEPVVYEPPSSSELTDSSNEAETESEEADSSALPQTGGEDNLWFMVVGLIAGGVLFGAGVVLRRHRAAP